MKIIVISGSTASGKTSLSIEMAKRLNCEIVNFDSLLFYKGMNIGTAKPSKSEMEGIPHHLIDIRPPSEPLNAKDYIDLAIPLINQLHEQGKNIIMVGGSGFYLRALLYGMYDSQTSSEEIIKKSNDLYELEGIIPFLNILRESDKISFEQLHENDHYRIRRAVEHFWTTGSPLSESSMKKSKELQNLNKSNSHDWTLLHFNLLIPKENHWRIIEERSKDIIQKGLIQEVKSLLASGLTGKEKPMNSIGYKEAQSFIREELNEEELLEKIYINTRRLAKAQKTWFKKDQFAKVINPINIEERELALTLAKEFFK